MPDSSSSAEVAESVDAAGLEPAGAASLQARRPVRVQIPFSAPDLLFGYIRQFLEFVKKIKRLEVPEMSTYLVSYDLRKPGRDYSKLYAAIRSYPRWAHILESDWAVVTDKSAIEVRDHLIRHVDANDALTVITARIPAAWIGIDQKVAAWLKENLN